MIITSRQFIWLLCGVVFYLTVLVVSAPVGVLEWLLPQLSGQKLYLQNSQGGLWKGEATSLMLKSAEGTVESLGRIKWRVLWLPILRGELDVSLDLTGEQRGSRGIVAFSFGRIHLRNIDAAIPISTLTKLFPNWMLWRLGGILEVRADKLYLGNNGLGGSAELRWQSASSGLSRRNPFGSYMVIVKESKLELTTLSGPLSLNGKGEWDIKGLRFEGTAQVETAAKPELQDFMRLFGKEGPDGGYRFVVLPSRQL